MSGNARDPGRSTIDRVLSLLEVIDAPGLTLTDIAGRAAIPLTTARRLLTALESWGAIERSAAGTFQIGLRLWEMGTRASSGSALREAARPYLQRLAETTGENVQMAVLHSGGALVIERLHGSRAVKIVSVVGHRLPLHATSVGHVLLAGAEPRVLREMCAPGLTRYTPRTQIMPGLLASTLADVRRTGVAYTHETLTMGLSSVAVPISIAPRPTVGAIGIVGRSATDFAAYEPALRDAARGTASALDRRPAELAS